MNSEETKLNTFFISEIGGDWGNEKETSDTPIKVLCIRGADIDDVRSGRLSSAPTRYVKQASKKKILTNKDIVIEISGGSPTQSTGRTALVTDKVLKNVTDPVVCSNFCRALRVKDEHCPLYVFYAMQNSYRCGYFFNFEGKTTGIKNLNLKSALNSIPVAIFERPAQQKIATVLSSLDEKIELNNRINTELEAMAKTLYDYWFVQFDFPDANGKPYRSSGGKMIYNDVLKRDIPVNWNEGQLQNIANITMGQSPLGSSYNIDGTGTVFFQGATDFGIRFPTTREYTTQPSRLAKQGDILMSVRAPVGTLNIAGTDCCIGRGLASLSSKDNCITYLYWILQNLKQVFDRRNVNGTTFGSITKDDFFTLPVIRPNIDVLDAFSKLTTPMFDKQNQIQVENQELVKLRDWLLPMLMNGQVTVK